MNDNLLYYCLKNIYTNININPKINVSQFNPQTQKLSSDIQINGLYIPHHYVNKGYLTLTNLCSVNFDNLGYNVDIKIYYSHKINNIKYVIQEIISRVYTMLYLFETEKIDYEIVMLLYELPRIIPIKYINTPNEINNVSSLGYFNCINGYYKQEPNKKFILVTRYNDCMGLLIHELSHATGLDIGGYSTFDEWHTYYNNHFNGKSGYFTEGINNTTASIIHCMLLGIKYDVDYKKLIQQEEDYVYNECCKLISFYFKNNKKECSIKDLINVYTQDGQMFEYNILRYIYLKYRDIFYNFKNMSDINTRQRNQIKNKIPQGFGNKIMFIYPNNLKMMNKYYIEFIKRLEEQKFNISGLKEDYITNNKKYFSMEYFKYNFNI